MISYKKFYFVKVPPICLYKTFGVLSVCFQINPVSPHHLVLVQADGHPRTPPLLPAPSSSLPGRKGFFFPIQEVSELFSSIAWLWNNYRLFLMPKIQPWGFPGGAVVENLPANAGDTGSSPGLGRSHMPWSNYALEPQLLSLRSAAREAVIVRGARTAMKSGPRSPQLEKALAQKRRPNTVKNK